MTYKAILFDMDGVIVDTEPLHVAAFQASLKHYGHDLSEKDYKQHFAGKTDEDGFKQYFAFINEEIDLLVIMDEKAKAYLKLAADQLVPYPGIIELIRTVSQHVPIALVTGSLRIEAEAVLNEFGITNCFTAVISANDVQHGKPDPEGYLKGAQAVGVDPADCIVIEDSPSGIEAARAAGIRCVAVTTTHAPDELGKATHVVEQLRVEGLDSL